MAVLRLAEMTRSFGGTGSSRTISSVSFTCQDDTRRSFGNVRLVDLRGQQSGIRGISCPIGAAQVRVAVLACCNAVQATPKGEAPPARQSPAHAVICCSKLRSMACLSGSDCTPSSYWKRASTAEHLCAARNRRSG